MFELPLSGINDNIDIINFMMILNRFFLVWFSYFRILGALNNKDRAYLCRILINITAVDVRQMKIEFWKNIYIDSRQLYLTTIEMWGQQLEQRQIKLIKIKLPKLSQSWFLMNSFKSRYPVPFRRQSEGKRNVPTKKHKNKERCPFIHISLTKLQVADFVDCPWDTRNYNVLIDMRLIVQSCLFTAVSSTTNIFEKTSEAVKLHGQLHINQ